MSRGGNIQGVVRLQNQNYLVTESLKCSLKSNEWPQKTMLVATIMMKIMMKYNPLHWHQIAHYGQLFLKHRVNILRLHLYDSDFFIPDPKYMDVIIFQGANKLSECWSLYPPTHILDLSYHQMIFGMDCLVPLQDRNLAILLKPFTC